MKNLFLLALLFFMTSSVHAQSVLACTGNNQIAGALQQSYTLGESFIGENTVDATVSSRGFQQPEIPIFNLRMFIEGYYLGGGFLQSVIDPINLPLLADSVSISFIDTNLSSAPVFEKKILLETDGWASTRLPLMLFGHSYNLRINHRNSIETWSKFPISISTASTYDLTTP